jgi:hypothetical protein
LAAGGAVYGTQERVVDFTIGKAVTSTVDVVRKTLPVSTGKKGFETRTALVKTKDTVATNNGYGDWNVHWAAWKAGSALA